MVFSAGVGTVGVPVNAGLLILAFSCCKPAIPVANVAIELTKLSLTDVTLVFTSVTVKETALVALSTYCLLAIANKDSGAATSACPVVPLIVSTGLSAPVLNVTPSTRSFPADKLRKFAWPLGVIVADSK